MRRQLYTGGNEPSAKQRDTLSMLSVYFETYGCQMNVADSEMLAGLLAQEGYRLAESPGSAELVVVNTCSVRDHAESRASARITELVNTRRKRGTAQQIWVVGCMAERLGDTLTSQLPGVDRVVGAIAMETLHEHISEYLASRDTENSHELTPSGPTCFVPVMRGCDNFCSYCIVPHVRGREHSVESCEVVERVQRLAEQGVKEVTLIGQNVNSYRDQRGVSFPTLLQQVHGIDGIARIRFTTSHPKDCSDELIHAMADLPKLCSHLHLPVQSGSSRILGLMNRGYTRDDYLGLVERIQATVPGIDITTDVMTGFPGETDEDFGDTLSLFERVRYTTAFMFAFSPRSGTAAADMGDQVDPTTSKRRLSELISLQTSITKEHYRDMVGKTANVLLTERQARRGREWIGQDMGCKRVLYACSDDLTGAILDLKVTESSGMTLLCKGVNQCDS